MDVAGLTLMRLAADVLIEALASGMDPASDPGKAATKGIADISKFTPPGSINPAIYNAALLKLFNKNRQQAPMMSALRSQGQQMPQPGAGGAPQPQGGGGQPPMPMAA